MNKDKQVDTYPLEWNGELMGELEVWKVERRPLYYATINGERVKGSTFKEQGFAFRAGEDQFHKDMRSY